MMKNILVVLFALLFHVGLGQQAPAPQNNTKALEQQIQSLEQQIRQLEQKLKALPDSISLKNEMLEQKKDFLGQERGRLNTDIANITIVVTGIFAAITVVLGAFTYWINRDIRERYKNSLENIQQEEEKVKQALKKAEKQADKFRKQADEDILKIEQLKKGIEDKKTEAENSANKIYELQKSLETIDPKNIPKNFNELIQEALTSENKKTDLTAQAIQAENEGKWQNTIDLWEKVLEIDKKNARAYFGIAYSYGKLADEKQEPEKRNYRFQAIEKYQEALKYKPDYPLAWNNWGYQLGNLANENQEPEKREYIIQSKEKFLEAEVIEKGSGSYNLACVASLQGNEEECLKWLQVAKNTNQLESLDHIKKDKDFDSVRDKQWFKDFLASLSS